MARRKLRILYVTAEAAPYVTVGGLGEVGGAFPKALANKDCDVRRVMPCYKDIKSSDLSYVKDFPVPMGDGFETCILRQDRAEKAVPTYFLDNAHYFYREGVYSHPDDGVRFFFFCRAVVEMLKNISFKPDIIHSNDWHTGFLPLLIQKEFPSIRTVFTIHNLRYQGFIPADYLRGIVTERALFRLGWPEWLNFMKAGILYADRVTTVSPGYAAQILKPPHDEGLGYLLKQRENGIAGIINGIDTQVYSPSSDGVLSYPYDAKHLDNKAKNKAQLRESLGLLNKDAPLLSMVTRLDDSKGIDLLMKTLHKLDEGRFQLVVLGTGNPYYEGLLTDLAKERQGMMSVCFTYHPDLARRIYAASDMYLMPSKMEACGLGQMVAMRYGAVPIVFPVGGLCDTVLDFDQHGKTATGIYMKAFTPAGLKGAIDKALDLYTSKDWVKLVRNGMQMDFSWAQPVTAYHTLYQELLT